MTTEAWTSLKVGACSVASLTSGVFAATVADVSRPQSSTQWVPVFIIGIITAATPGFLAWLQGRSSHRLLNSRLDEFKKMMTEAEFAKGKVAGEEAQKAAVALKAEGAAEEKEKEKTP